MTMWTLWAATECEGHALRAGQNATTVKARNPAVYDTAVTALRPKFAVLDAALRDGGGFLVGGRFTVADLNVAEIVRYAQPAPELFTASPHVQAWITACQSRPGVHRHDGGAQRRSGLNNARSGPGPVRCGAISQGDVLEPSAGTLATAAPRNLRTRWCRGRGCLCWPGSGRIGRLSHGSSLPP